MCDVVKSNYFYRIRSYRAKIFSLHFMTLPQGSDVTAVMHDCDWTKQITSRASFTTIGIHECPATVVHFYDTIKRARISPRSAPFQ